MTAAASSPLWLEVGCEELPPDAVRVARAQLPGLLRTALSEVRLPPAAVRVFATPRRITAWVEGVPPRQTPECKTVTGPPRERAFDAAGHLTPAGQGFLKKWGLSAQDARVAAVGKGEYLVADVTSPCRAAPEVLTAAIPSALTALPFTKTMRWPQSDTPFPRPVRWLVGLWGRTVVPFRFAGLTAGALSWGHRTLAPGPHEIREAVLNDGGLDLDALLAFYEKKLGVILDLDHRRRRVVDHLSDVAVDGQYFDRAGAEVRSAWERVMESTEYPSLVAGGFDDRYLAMPDEVVEAALLGYLNLFPLRDREGRLLPRFFAVYNGRPEAADNVRAGLERVLRARLADASYFWETDNKTPWEEMLRRLEGVVFAAGAGTLADKKSRLTHICNHWTEERGDDLTPFVPLEPQERERLRRAAELCKADLVSLMVREKEFTHLQGRMGRLYALQREEPPEVADAIGEHYAPAGAEDAVPPSPLGRLLSLADKVDTLVCLFGAGHKPTGTKDPFGLRRAAIGACRLWLEDDEGLFIHLPVQRAVAAAAKAASTPPATDKEVELFILERLAQIFREQGYADDAVNAVVFPAPEFQLPLTSPRDLAARLQALAALRQKREEYLPLAVAFKRAINIVRQGKEQGAVPDGAAVNQNLMTHPQERELWNAYRKAKEGFERATAARDYRKALSALAELRPTVDAFFDAVMVMCPEAPLRTNRLALMRDLAWLFLNFADFTRLRGEESYL